MSAVLRRPAKTSQSIVDYTSPALCTIPPSRRQAMRPIINMPEEGRATDIYNMHKNMVKIARVVPEISSRTDRHTDRQYRSQYFATAPAAK